MAGRRSDAEARETRAAILARAADSASVDGLEGLTIGRLAADVGLSKAGVLGHFGTKEGLQLATLEHAAALFRERVWTPAAEARPGIERLLAICAAWTAYAADPPFRGGCFMAAAAFEFDDRDGAVHEQLAAVLRRWRRTLVAEVRTAIEDGDLPADCDPELVAFTLDSLAVNTNPERGIHDATAAAERTLRAMHWVLGRGAGVPA
ncbi:TetR/AcrR family transcriptional regulator [Patulibacter defluvii]|uniref:TetR/AcrR family transcriptional regulator n=1 Tax=Patulibacter defluvii TaxID=3095358 RepID=UPI002A7642A0|nr:TetR/AcrR family transcriptional regulator [Patulibacter sp. DM4]